MELEHYNFKGWYTAANCGGVQIADNIGLNPIVSIVNAENFEIADGNTRINLYAGFEVKQYSVTLRFNGKPDEVVKAAYGTNVSELVYKTRADDGKAVSLWADSSSEAYTGTVNGDMTLYALEWANCISFDVDGGAGLAPVVADAGAAIKLPTPSKPLSKFLRWEKDGSAFTSTVMPSESVTLKAVWQAQLEFDSNGGSEVQPVSAAEGSAITLPKPSREGYFFAGWYTADEQKYTQTSMPAAGVALKAGWHKAVTVKQTLSVSSSSAIIDYEPSFKQLYASVDPSKLFPSSVGDDVRMTWHFKARHSDKSMSMYFKVNFYSQKTASDAYLITSQKVENITSSWRNCEITTTFKPTDIFYIMFLTQYVDGNWSVTSYYISDLYVECEYADASKLYL